MFRKLLISMFAIGLLATGSAFAHGGHDHEPIDKEKAIEKAKVVVSQMVKKSKLDASWENVKSIKASKKAFKEGNEWFISFENKTIKDSSKSTLYVFLTLSGEYLAANFTGK